MLNGEVVAIDIPHIIDLIVNGGGSAVLLYLLLREQARSQRLEERVIELASKLTAFEARVTKEVRAVGQSVTNGK